MVGCGGGKLGAGGGRWMFISACVMLLRWVS
jgi:hypothetical protein